MDIHFKNIVLTAVLVGIRPDAVVDVFVDCDPLEIDLGSSSMILSQRAPSFSDPTSPTRPPTLVGVGGFVIKWIGDVSLGVGLTSVGGWTLSWLLWIQLLSYWVALTDFDCRIMIKSKWYKVFVKTFSLLSFRRVSAFWRAALQLSLSDGKSYDKVRRNFRWSLNFPY